MPKFEAWPSWRYGPNGEAKIFHREEDVPAGWKDTPSAVFEPPAPPPPPAMDRNEAIAALTARGIPFKRNMPTAALVDLLNEHSSGHSD